MFDKHKEGYTSITCSEAECKNTRECMLLAMKPREKQVECWIVGQIRNLLKPNVQNK